MGQISWPEVGPEILQEVILFLYFCWIIWDLILMNLALRWLVLLNYLLNNNGDDCLDHVFNYFSLPEAIE